LSIHHRYQHQYTTSPSRSIHHALHAPHFHCTLIHHTVHLMHHPSDAPLLPMHQSRTYLKIYPTCWGFCLPRLIMPLAIHNNRQLYLVVGYHYVILCTYYYLYCNPMRISGSDNNHENATCWSWNRE
jgi:hypothetical protein